MGVFLHFGIGVMMMINRRAEEEGKSREKMGTDGCENSAISETVVSKRGVRGGLGKKVSQLPYRV